MSNQLRFAAPAYFQLRPPATTGYQLPATR